MNSFTFFHQVKYHNRGMIVVYCIIIWKKFEPPFGSSIPVSRLPGSTTCLYKYKYILLTLLLLLFKYYYIEKKEEEEEKNK